MDYEWWAGAPRFLDRFDVGEWEAMQVLDFPRRVLIPATTEQGLPVLTVWGRTHNGRPLVVTLRKLREPAGRWQILFARQMSPEQLDQYTAWEQR